MNVISANGLTSFVLVSCHISPLSRGHDGVHHLDDPVQCRVGADGHVGAAEVVIDGADHSNNVEFGVAAGRVLIDQP